MTIAYSYLRLSRKKQIKGHGKDRQWDAAVEACKEYGWTLSNMTFQDLGLSAYKGEHLEEGGAFRKFLDSIREGVITRGSVLIVENPDRISRQGVNESASLMLQILNAGVMIYTIFDKRLYRGDKDTALMDLMVWGIQAQRAFDESDTKSKRLRGHKAKQREIARTGKAGLIGKVPAWIDTIRPVDGEPYYALNPERAEVIRTIFKLKINGLTPNGIAKHLEENGIPTWSNTVKNWSHYTIRRWLKSPTTYGQLQLMYRNDNGESVPDGDPINNFYPPVIDKKTFVQAQQTMKKVVRGRVGINGRNVLRGLLRCSCGGSLHVQESKTRNGRKIAYLRCSEAYTTRPCPRPAFRYNAFETFVCGALQLLDWGSLYEHRAGISEGELGEVTLKLNVVLADIADLEKRVESLLNAIEHASPETIEIYAKRIDGYNQEIKELREQELDLVKRQESLSALVQASSGSNLGFSDVRFQQLEINDTAKRKENRLKINQLLSKELDRVEVSKANNKVDWRVEVFDVKGDSIIEMTINKKGTNAWIDKTTYFKDSPILEISYRERDYRKRSILDQL